MSDTAADDSSLHRVASTDDLDDGESAVVSAGDAEVALFNVEGDFHALKNVCPHQGGPLGKGRVEDACVYCPWHGWQFDVTTGEHVQSDAAAERYEVVVDGDDVYVRLT